MTRADSSEPRPLDGVRRLEITETKIAFAGRAFETVGRYQHISGRLHCELDPQHRLNIGIVDLEHTKRNARGFVAYQVEFELLKPLDDRRGNGWLFYEVANRGNKLAISRFNHATALNRFDREADAGDGLLMRKGFSILWTGWQGDVSRGGDRLIADLPAVVGADGPVIGLSREEFIAEATGLPTDEFIQHLSPDRFVAALSYAAASMDAAQARLTIRQRERDSRVMPEDLAWRYVDESHIEISRPSGFDHSAIYEFIYPARDPIAMGVGLASIRDAVSFFRTGSDSAGASNPLRPGAISHTLGFGASQSGRVLRDFVYQGFNEGLDGSRVFDAILPVVTGARRSFVNARFAQPGRYSRQHEDHLFPGDQFPFAYPTTADPISGRTDGILARANAAGVCPKVIHLDADTELWAGRASLLVTDCAGDDIAMPDNVRLFLAACVPHSNTAPAKSDVVQQRHNPLGYSTVLRALLIALIEWEEQGVAPPDSRFPSRSDGTLVTVDEFRRAFPRIPGLELPASCNGVALTDYTIQPSSEGRSYPVYVGSVDRDGNTLGGVRYPIVSAPVATVTGWNLRADGFARGALFNIHGSLIPLAGTEADRKATNDPRPSLNERYGSRALFLDKLAAAAAGLVKQRLLLQEDADLILARASKASFDLNDLV